MSGIPEDDRFREELNEELREEELGSEASLSSDEYQKRKSEKQVAITPAKDRAMLINNIAALFVAYITISLLFLFFQSFIGNLVQLKNLMYANRISLIIRRTPIIIDAYIYGLLPTVLLGVVLFVLRNQLFSSKGVRKGTPRLLLAWLYFVGKHMFFSTLAYGFIYRNVLGFSFLSTGMPYMFGLVFVPICLILDATFTKEFVPVFLSTVYSRNQFRTENRAATLKQILLMPFLIVTPFMILVNIPSLIPFKPVYLLSIHPFFWFNWIMLIIPIYSTLSRTNTVDFVMTYHRRKNYGMSIQLVSWCAVLFIVMRFLMSNPIDMHPFLMK